MASVYSTKFFVYHELAAEALVVPDGETWVLRTIAMFAPGVELGVLAQIVDHATAATIWWNKFSDVTAGDYFITQDCRIVCEAGDQLDISATGGLGSTADLAAWGYRLTDT